MDRSDFIVLLARQRSGTNALRSVLDSHPDLFCLPEVFNPTPTGLHEANYFSFLERNAPHGVTAILRSGDAQEQLFLDFLAYPRGRGNPHHRGRVWIGLTRLDRPRRRRL